MKLREVANIAYFFLQDVPDITVDSPGVGKPCDVSIFVDEIEIFNEKLYGDGNGDVNLHDLPSLLGPYINSGMHTVSVNMTPIYVFFCREEIDEYVSPYVGIFQNWLSKNFLTRTKDHLVAMDESVFVWIMSDKDKEERLQMSITYLEGNRTKRVTRSANVMLKAYTPFAMTTSLEQLASLVEGEIMGVVIASETKKHVIHRMIGKQSITLKYDNAFGLTEYVSLQGELKEKPQYEFSTALMNGRSQNVAINEKKIYEFNTSAISESTLERIKDAIKAENIQLIRGNKAFDIVFETADLAHSDMKKDLQGVTFSFYRAINNRLYIENVDTEMINRIFSDEFDLSFN